MTARRVALVVVLLIGLLAPVVGAGSGRAADEQDALAAVQAVLDQRSSAILSGDRGSFLATVDPSAPAAFQQGQQRSFDGLRSMPLASYSLEARLFDTGDFGPAIAHEYGGSEVFLPETRQRMRLRDYDDRDAVDSLWLTFVKRDDTWYVGADDDLSAVGVDSFKGLWDQGPVQAKPTEHFLVLSHPSDSARADALAAIAEEAAAILDSRWDQPWSKKIPLILPSNPDELELLLQSTVDLDKFVAFVSYGSVRDDDWVATAARIYIQDQNLSGYNRAYQVQTLVHELTHAAAAVIAGPFVPSWVHEGVAEWEANGQPDRRASPAGTGVPRDHQFATGESTAIVAAYAASESAITAVAARSGKGAPSALLATIGADKVAPGTADYRTDQALRKLTGLGLTEFEAYWTGR